MRKYSSVTLAVAASLLIAGCMQDTPRSAAATAEKAQAANLEQSVISNIADNVIIATYRDLNARSHEMVKLAEALRANPTQENLIAVQLKWRETRIPWEQSESFVFGPSADTDAPIDSWPLNLELLKELLTKPDLGVGFVRTLNPLEKGFHTAEFLIFGDGKVKNTKSVSEMTASEMTFLVSVTTVISEETALCYYRWTQRFIPADASSPAFVDIVRNPGPENKQYLSTKAVLNQYIRAMAKIANEVGATKLQTPLGGDIDHAEPSQVESQFSWNSLMDFNNNIHSIRNMYTGDYGSYEGPGLDEIIKKKNPALDLAMHAALNEAEASILAIAGPENMSYTQAIKNEAARTRARAAIQSVGRLFTLIDTQLIKEF